MGLVTEYPLGFVLLCLLIGAIYAFILYFRDIRQGLKQMTHRVMLVFRFLAVSLIAFLLLGPMIKQSDKLVEKPIVILGIDNSRSIVLTSDSNYYKTQFPESIKLLVEALQQKCDVKTYSFGSNLSSGFDATFSGIKTDMSSFFNEVNTRFSNRNAAALVVASDGIYNEGTDPFYAARKITFPVYTIPLGDTLLKKDILIRKVMVNKSAYKGDQFPVEALIEMNKCAGAVTKLTLSQGSQLIETKEIRANSDHSIQKVAFMLEAKDLGVFKYSMKLSEIEGEGSKMNNYANFIVEILDARQKIALIVGSPHPDVMAVQKGLEGSSHFEIELLHVSDLPKTYDKYDLVILNQLPTVTNVADFVPLFKSKASLLIIIGSLTDINALNTLKPGLIINASKSSFLDSQPIFNEDFSLFTVDKKVIEAFKEFPPLQSPFGSYQFSPLTDVLFYQRIGNITTRTPLVMFTRVADKKVGFIAGENIWRWRISDYVRQSNHESFDLLIDKIAQYLSTKDDKSFFRIHLNNRISENEPVELEAEVFNASYELINEPDINITISDAENKTYPFVFGKTPNAYYLNAGLFPVGEYSYKASVKVGSELYQKSGKFFIEQVNIESSNLVADHNILFRIASSHDGEMIDKADIDKLADKILAREDIRSVSIYRQKMTDLIGNPWLFVMILALLAAEWVIRKREGM
ncbi:MAG: hypothetical protein Q8M08_04940 [Bacteroidales bacterium]|nr:hypothetical protein [Bacteroidales bacterium]